MFPASGADKPIHANSLSGSWCRVRCDIGLQDVRLHDLRHSYASIAVKAGENILTIGRLLGHSDPGTTLKYIHLAEDEVAEAAESLGAVLARTAA